jgi:hypothetical protein
MGMVTDMSSSVVLDVNVTLFEMTMFFHFNFPMVQIVDVATVQHPHFKEQNLDILGNRYSDKLLHGVTDFYVPDRLYLALWDFI